MARIFFSYDVQQRWYPSRLMGETVARGANRCLITAWADRIADKGFSGISRFLPSQMTSMVQLSAEERLIH